MMRKFRAVYEQEPEPDGRWNVAIPEVQGCYTWGHTIEEARERIREALGLYIEGAESVEIEDDIRAAGTSDAS